MKSIEKVNKIQAVVLYILQHFKNGVDYIKLFKIMYFAQREYLARYGLTLTEDTFKARTLGPVPALTYKVIKMVESNADFNAEAPDLANFAASISIRHGQKVYAKASPDMDYIAEMEKQELDTTINTYKNIKSDKLSELSHDDAYNKVAELMKEDPQKDILTLIDIAKAGGATEKTVAYIRECQLLKAAMEC